MFQQPQCNPDLTHLTSSAQCYCFDGYSAVSVFIANSTSAPTVSPNSGGNWQVLLGLIYAQALVLLSTFSTRALKFYRERVQQSFTGSWDNYYFYIEQARYCYWCYQREQGDVRQALTNCGIDVQHYTSRATQARDLLIKYSPVFSSFIASYPVALSTCQKTWSTLLRTRQRIVATFTSQFRSFFCQVRNFFYKTQNRIRNMAGLLGGGGGGGPLDTVTGAASGLTGKDGPLGGATDLAGGALGGGALDSVTGLAGGLGGGLLGGGEGLNLIGLVGVGSDEKALLDLNPAEKKEVKAKKMQIAKAREQERQRQ